MALGFRGFNRGASSVPKSLVTYNVDTGTSYQEKVKKGDTVLSPTSFTPTKTGYTFAGWKNDTGANLTVLTTLVATGKPMTLYAVFRKTITVTYNGNGSDGGYTSVSSTLHIYNNGNAYEPAITVRTNGFTKTNYSFYAWRLNDASTGDRYREGDSLSVGADATLYVEWIASTLEVVNNGTYITGTKSVRADAPWSTASQYAYWNLLTKGDYQTATAYASVTYWNNDGNRTGSLRIGCAGIDSVNNIVASPNNNTGSPVTFYGNKAIDVGQHYVFVQAIAYDDYWQYGEVSLYSVILSNPTKW